MTLLKDDAALSIRDYFGFHCLLRGKCFKTPDGKLLSKLDVWSEHHRFPDMIRNIAAGRNHEYVIVDKDGWSDGKLMDSVEAMKSAKRTARS